MGNRMKWWGPRAQNSGSPCAKVIFLVFFVFSSVRNSGKCEKAMKFQSQFNVTHRRKTLIFIATRRSTCENTGFFKNRSGAYIVSILEVFGVTQWVKRDARGGSSGALWNVWAMPKTSDFVTIQARERLRQDGKWTCTFRQNTVFIDILAPNGFPSGIWNKIWKFEVHMALLAKPFLVIFNDLHWNLKVDIWKFQVEP